MFTFKTRTIYGINSWVLWAAKIDAVLGRFADNAVCELNVLPRDKHVMPWGVSKTK